jgi:hypothetical protein
MTASEHVSRTTLESGLRTQGRQVCGRDDQDRFILSVITKRTYRIQPGKNLVLADEQLPLVDDPVFDQVTGELVADTDLYPYKLATDVVIKGHAYVANTASGASPSGEVAVRIGLTRRRIAVFGDRRCVLSSGRIKVSRQAPIEKVPFSFAFAYGGRDRVAEMRYGNRALEWAGPLCVEPELLSDASPYLYPRNYAGRGYLIEPTSEAVDAVRLPNLEDPDNLLTPDRLAVGTIDRWPAMPLPAVFSWVHPAWFPRIVLAGLPYTATGFVGEPEETLRGWAPSALLNENTSELAGLRFANGASFGMQLSGLHGGEPVILEGLRPGGERLAFNLPTEPPELFTDGRKGKLNPTTPVLHSVVVEPDQMRLSMVWRGAAPALRLYFPEELARMPFQITWP